MAASPTVSRQPTSVERCSARKAAAGWKTPSRVPERKWRQSQGNARGKSLALTVRGPRGTASQPGTFQIIPGWKVGIAVSATSIPELPWDAPALGALSSTTATEKLRR